MLIRGNGLENTTARRREIFCTVALRNRFVDKSLHSFFLGDEQGKVILLDLFELVRRIDTTLVQNSIHSVI
jgi:hypothetical protein